MLVLVCVDVAGVQERLHRGAAAPVATVRPVRRVQVLVAREPRMTDHGTGRPVRRVLVLVVREGGGVSAHKTDHALEHCGCCLRWAAGPAGPPAPVADGRPRGHQTLVLLRDVGSARASCLVVEAVCCCSRWCCCSVEAA